MIVTKGMFDKTFDIEIEGITQKITLKPLKTVYLESLMELVSELQIKPTGNEEQDSKLMLEKVANKEITHKIIEICEASISRSYPEWDKDMVNDFVSINMFKILPLVIQVNIRNEPTK